MEKKTHLVCVICCTAFRKKDGVKDKSVQSFKRFCEEILAGGEAGNNLREKLGFLWGEGSGLTNKWSKPKQGRGGASGRCHGKKKKISKVTGGDLQEGSEVGGEIPVAAKPLMDLEGKISRFVDNPDDNLGICEKCSVIMDSVTDARLSLKPVEERVYKLQMLLLRETRRLHRKMDVVWREFGRVEEMKDGGDRKFVENCLDQSYLHPRKGKKGKQKVFGRISDEHWERKQEIWGVRAKISAVFSDLDKYHEEMKEKFGKSSRITEALKKVEETQKTVVVKEEPMEYQDNQEDYFCEDNSTCSMGRDDGNGDDDFNEGDTSEPMDLDEYIKNLCEEDNDSPSGEENGNDSDNTSLGDEDDNEEEEDPSDDDDYTPITRTKRFNSLLIDFEWHLSKLSPFKRGIVESVLKCQRRHLKNKLDNKNKPRAKILEAEALLTPYQRHMAKLSYHLESQTIYLSDIPIKILCKEDNSSGNGMICTKCNFQVPESPDIETQMYDHVLSKHFNAYQCPHCGDDNLLETDVEYRKHVRICRESVNCDICGKPFASGSGLKGHKWSHMSEEERKEAVEQGLMKEPRHVNLKELPRLHQCTTCGKGFRFAAELRSHEVVHQDRSEREQFMCPKCGKSFLKAGFEYHVKWSDSCGEEEQVSRRVQCLQCDKTFKNKHRLRNHVIMIHTERANLKPFVCDICGKAYKLKTQLKEHNHVHTGEMYKCGVCGTGFTRYSNMKRHQKNCGK